MRAFAAARAFLRSGPTWGAPLCGYTLLALALTWPLPKFLQTRLLGQVGGDLGVYVWNLWIFRHEIVEHGEVPISTDHVFAYTNGADFSLHNYTPLADLLGLPLVGAVGLVGAFNLLLLVTLAVSALSTFALCTKLGASRLSAWCAGALFIASPLMVARQTAHFSLVMTAALPLFLWALWQALDTGKRRDGVLVGAMVAIATYSDAYYGIYCALMGAVVLAWRLLRVERALVVAPRRWLAPTLNVVAASGLAIMGWLLMKGPGVIEVGPLHATMHTMYTPVLVTTGAILLRLCLAWRPRVAAGAGAEVRRLLPAGVMAAALCLVLLLPMLAPIAMRYQRGEMPDTPTLWRSSPRGVDLLAFVVPNPNHAIIGRWTRGALLPDRTDAFPEYIASFSLVALAVIGIAAARRALPGLWVTFTLFFAALSLGPFIHIGGVNTYVIGPWALLRYVPVIGMARTPTRFAIVAALGGSILFAFALDRWLRERPRRGIAAALLAVAFVLELSPLPRVLYSADVPAFYDLIAAGADPSRRVLELPTGVRDGTSSIGNFNASTLYFQTRHGHPIIGGYLSRVSEARKRANRRAPMLRALNALSEPGGHVPAAWLDEARAARDRFLSRSCLGFVVVNKQLATPELRAFAVETLNLTPVHEDAGYELLVPIDPPPCVRRPRASALAFSLRRTTAFEEEQ